MGSCRNYTPCGEPYTNLLLLTARFCSITQKGALALATINTVGAFINRIGFWCIRLMDKILHYLKDPKLWELWYIPYNG